MDSIAGTQTAIMYQYYNGLYAALSKKHNCFLWGKKISSIEPLLKICPFLPDVIVFGIGWEYFEEIEGLDSVDIPIIFFVFKPQISIDKKLNFCLKSKARLILSSIPDYHSYQQKTGIESRRFCYAVDESVFYPRDSSKIYDVGFSGALHDNKLYQKNAFTTLNIRSRIQEMLLQNKNLKTMLNGSDSVAPRIRDYNQYAKTMSECKIWFATQAAFGDITPRYFEVPMSGTLLLCSSIPDSYRDIFRNGENCVEFDNDLSNFNDKLDYSLNNWERISEKAQKEFRSKHTWDIRAEELTKIAIEIGANNASK